MDTVRINRFGTKLIAHRGLSGIECENTAAAFVAAGNRDYFGIETDIHLTADGRFIVIHDDKTGRVSPDNLSVENSSFSELRSLRLADYDGKIREDLCPPSLEEYLRICRKYEKTAVLELKNPFSKTDIERILKTVRNEYSIAHMIFISFDYNNMVLLRELEPKAVLQYLTSSEINSGLIEKLERYALDLDIEYRNLDRNSVEMLHSRGIKINCWTVNDKASAERLAGWGVDFITTNILQ